MQFLLRALPTVLPEVPFLIEEAAILNLYLPRLCVQVSLAWKAVAPFSDPG